MRFSSPVGGDLDNEYTNSREEQEMDPATRREQIEDYPGNNQSYAGPPMHRVRESRSACNRHHERSEHSVDFSDQFQASYEVD